MFGLVFSTEAIERWYKKNRSLADSESARLRYGFAPRPTEVAGTDEPGSYEQFRDAKFAAWRDTYRPSFNTEVRQLKDGWDAGYAAAWETVAPLVAELERVADEVTALKAGQGQEVDAAH